jgi:hypothetical protein
VNKVGIANLALAWLGVEQRIVNFEEGTKRAALIAEQFDGLRDAVLEDRDWTFATERLLINKAATAPAWGYKARHVLPGQVIRVIIARELTGTIDAFMASLGDADDPGSLDWRVEGRFVVSDSAAAQLAVKAIVRVEDISMWTPGFCQALAARIAADLCFPITTSRSLMADMNALYERKLDAAAGNDGRQGRSDRRRATWAKARRR